MEALDRGRTGSFKRWIVDAVDCESSEPWKLCTAEALDHLDFRTFWLRFLFSPSGVDQCGAVIWPPPSRPAP